MDVHAGNADHVSSSPSPDDTAGTEGSPGIDDKCRPADGAGVRDVAPEASCPHGGVALGARVPDGVAPCVTCSPPLAEMRDALERIRDMTGDTRVRRVAEDALARL